MKYRNFNRLQTKKSNTRRSRRLSRDHRISKRNFGAAPKKEARHHRKGGYKEIIAPQNFTLVGNPNPEEVVQVINKLKYFLDKKRKVFVVLRHITKIDTDAIVVLLAAIVRFKALNVDFNGDFPDSWECKKTLEESGFFQVLFKEKFKDKPSYLLKSNTLMTHASRAVDSARTAKIIENAAITVWGEPLRCQGVQTTFLELMQNTLNHASLEKEGEKHWWLSVKHEPENKKVRFAFVDYGVGVFTSLENKPSNNKFYGAITKMWEKFRYGDNAELLRLILNGELHKTITNEYFRGQGLPGMIDSLEENWFSNLHIITNNVYANVGRNTYKLMNLSFGGTFLYWEIGASNRNFPMTR